MQDDRLPVGGREPPMDPRDERLDLVIEGPGTPRSSCGSGARSWMKLKRPRRRAPFEAFHGEVAPRCLSCSRYDRRQRRFEPRGGAHAPPARDGGTRRQQGRRPTSGSATRWRWDRRGPASSGRRERGVQLSIDACLQVAIDRVEREVVAVLLRVKADDAAPEEPAGTPRAAGRSWEPFDVSAGDVPEREDRGLRRELAQMRRREREVIVLHGDGRVVAIHLVGHCGSELRIHGPVSFEVAGSELWTRMGDVTERPEPFVRSP